MTGKYITKDDCTYEVFTQKAVKGSATELRAICIKSTVRLGPFESFPISEKNVQTNLNAKSWTKIQS